MGQIRSPRKRTRTRRKRAGKKIPQGAYQLRSLAWGGAASPPEENADLPDFTPERVHLFLQEVYGDFPHHNYGSDLDGEVVDNAVWQRRWHRLAV